MQHGAMTFGAKWRLDIQRHQKDGSPEGLKHAEGVLDNVPGRGVELVKVCFNLA